MQALQVLICLVGFAIIVFVDIGLAVISFADIVFVDICFVVILDITPCFSTCFLMPLDQVNC